MRNDNNKKFYTNKIKKELLLNNGSNSNILKEYKMTLNNLSEE
jgi:hypothetical protein